MPLSARKRQLQSSTTSRNLPDYSYGGIGDRGSGIGDWGLGIWRDTDPYGSNFVSFVVAISETESEIGSLITFSVDRRATVRPRCAPHGCFISHV